MMKAREMGGLVFFHPLILSFSFPLPSKESYSDCLTSRGAAGDYGARVDNRMHTTHYTSTRFGDTVPKVTFGMVSVMHTVAHVMA